MVLQSCLPATREVKESVVRSWLTLEPDDAASSPDVPMCRPVRHVLIHREAVETRQGLPAKQRLLAAAAGAGLTLAGAGVTVAVVAPGHQDPPRATVEGMAPVIGGLAGTGLFLLFVAAFSNLASYEKHDDWGTAETVIASDDTPCPSPLAGQVP